MTEKISGGAFKQMVAFGAACITAQKQAINDLNVFPVPDGDTGTNMSLTIQTAVNELRKAEPATVDEAAKLTASGLLRGARGNSGVILSLLFRGMSKVLKGHDTADGALLAEAIGLGIFVLSPLLIAAFNSSPEVIAYGIQRFSVVSVTYFLCGMMDVGSGVVRGLGYSIMPMLVSMVGACVFRVIWIFTVFRMYHTLFTLYVSYPISWVLTVIAHMICYLIVRRRMFPEKAA